MSQVHSNIELLEVQQEELLHDELLRRELEEWRKKVKEKPAVKGVELIIDSFSLGATPKLYKRYIWLLVL